jgi:PKHD-type hydroxylase
MANQATEWGFSLTGQEKTQVCRYKSIDEGYYDWHVDAYPPQNGTQRKLSCVILLNDAENFEGGVLELKGLDEQITFTKQGSVIVFPSFIEHKVTPVTKGVRYTAVVWALGPAFK